MTASTGKRKHHHKSVKLADPDVKSWNDWPEENREFHEAFLEWLKQGGYGASSLQIYGAAARMALGYLDKPYTQIDILMDISRVQQHLASSHRTAATQRQYQNGIIKLAEYLLALQAPESKKRPHLSERGPYLAPEQKINWDYYFAGLPEWLIEDIQAFLRLCRRNWRPERQHRATLEVVSGLTTMLRWINEHVGLADITDITPEIWKAYVEARTKKGISNNTHNISLHRLHSFLRFLEEEGRLICNRMRYVKELLSDEHQYRDVPVEQIRLVLEEIEKQIQSDTPAKKRMGLMDKAWFLLMLHGGLRTGELRFLKLAHIDWENRRLKIEMSKGFKERLIYLSDDAMSALKTYLGVRGKNTGKDWVFLYRQELLSNRYCQQRLQTYGKLCQVRITPHQLRFTCATLMLNSGIPASTVQVILGHQHIDTTLYYARLFEKTVTIEIQQSFVHNLFT
jgi:site-specific recombinase XerD